MRLIYTDEAGTSAREPVRVVVSVIVHADHQQRLLEKELKRLIDERVPKGIRQGFICHAKEIFGGGKAIDRDLWDRADRFDFLREIVAIPRRFDAPIAVGIVFAGTISRLVNLAELKVSPATFDLAAAFGSCMERADGFLRKYLKGAEVGSVVAEDIDQKRILARVGLCFRREPMMMPGDHFQPDKFQKEMGIAPRAHEYRIDHIIDAPNFVAKRHAPLLQLADACAFSFRRCLSKQSQGEDLLLAMLGPVEGTAFLEDEIWFSGIHSGLFGTRKYWRPEHFREALARA